MHPGCPPLGCSLRPKQDAVRLAQQPKLAFAAADIMDYQQADGPRPARLTVNALGLFGTR